MGGCACSCDVEVRLTNVSAGKKSFTFKIVALRLLPLIENLASCRPSSVRWNSELRGVLRA